jgi:hypothetical protein
LWRAKVLIIARLEAGDYAIRFETTQRAIVTLGKTMLVRISADGVAIEEAQRLPA